MGKKEVQFLSRVLAWACLETAPMVQKVHELGIIIWPAIFMAREKKLQ